MSTKHRHALRTERMYNRRPVNPFNAKVVLAEMHDDTVLKANDEGFTQADLDRLHGQALAMNDNGHLCASRDCGLAGWECTLLREYDGDDGNRWTDRHVHEELVRQEREEMAREEAAYDAGYGGYSDDPDLFNDSSIEGCWLSYMNVEQARETFGGTDFLVVRSGW